MIRTIVDVAVGHDQVGTYRETRHGDRFPIGVLVEAVGPGPVVFDTIVIEVFYNSGAKAGVHIGRGERPVAGELVARGKRVVDILTGEPLRPGRLTDDPPLSHGSPMAMPERTAEEVAGPYRSRSGAAGYVSREPFVLEGGAPPVGFAYGMVEARLEGTRPAETAIWTTGYALYKDEPVPIAPKKSTVRVAAKSA